MEVAVGYVNDDFLKGKRTIRAGPARGVRDLSRGRVLHRHGSLI
jgi:hypothetical protein